MITFILSHIEMVPVCVNLSVHLCVFVCVSVSVSICLRYFVCVSFCVYPFVHVPIYLSTNITTRPLSIVNIKSNQIKSQPHTAYGTLYESSIAYGIRKALMAQQKLTELDSKLRLLASSKVRNRSTVGKGKVKVWNNEMVIVR